MTSKGVVRATEWWMAATGQFGVPARPALPASCQIRIAKSPIRDQAIAVSLTGET